jgi:hypothetical protein
MKHNHIIKELSANKDVFHALFTGTDKEQYTWKPAPDKWSLLEVLCHLYDEEREDFRARLKHTLETPEVKMPKIDPKTWVTERKYAEQDYDAMLKKFLDEREASIKWLERLKDPQWKNIYHHPKAGELSAEMFLANWLAHDYLHFRQITKLKYDFMKTHYNVRFDYAGDW